MRHRLPRIMCQTNTGIMRTVRTVDGKPVRGDDGLPVVDESQFSIPRSSLQPASGNTETLGAQDMTQATWTLYAPPDNPNLSATAAVLKRDGSGEALEVAGDVQIWPDSDGNPHHVEIPLREVAG